jgi:hypothetical protein
MKCKYKNNNIQWCYTCNDHLRRKLGSPGGDRVNKVSHCKLVNGVELKSNDKPLYGNCKSDVTGHLYIPKWEREREV